MKIIIATRKSHLALWQAEYVKEKLLSLDCKLEVELLPMTTRGDKILDVPLAKIGGKGLFLKELETAILEGQADIAVHSMKDVPMEFPKGLQLSAICQRENPRDAFVSNHFENFKALPSGARIGTSSLRRKAQLSHARPDLKFVELRGNVQTRLSKLDAGEYDAIILATAGLLRLGLQNRIKQNLDFDLSLPAGGQGAVGIESRSHDTVINNLLRKLNHPETELCVIAERAVNTKLMGGCQVPIAAHAEIVDGSLLLSALVASVDGREILHSKSHGLPTDAWEIGESVAKDLLAQGAQRLLDAISDDISANIPHKTED